MATPENCIATWENPCELLDCIFGFNGSVDPLPLGYGKDEIEVIAGSGNADFCHSILVRAVEAELIPEFRVDDNGNPGGDGGGSDGGGDTGDGGEDVSIIAQGDFNILPIGALAWLLTS